MSFMPSREPNNSNHATSRCYGFSKYFFYNYFMMSFLCCSLHIRHKQPPSKTKESVLSDFKMGMNLTETVNDSPVVTLQSAVGVNDCSVGRELKLLFLGCESNAPYGPFEHTANLFMNLITASLQEAGAQDYLVILDVYHASKGHLPSRDAYAQYDGIILPGSFNSAYDTEPWILQLSKVIQQEIVSKELPTLGVCFGHQLYAHSFEEGSAIKCPAGPQAGRKVSTISAEGRKWLPSFNDLQLFYTHGDMVASLPPQGHVLGGTETVPIQAAIYFSKVDDQKPIAVTFQAHPEYASSRTLGLDRTLNQIMEAMYERRDISDDELQRVKSDAIAEFDTVQKHSIECMLVVGRILGWFPETN
jgi:GMP synthase-like glutamine amidotransferase